MSEPQAPQESPANQDLVTNFLASREVVCPACDYPLTDLPSGNCPECGLALELKLTLTKPRQLIYVTGIVGLTLGIGFFGVLWLGYLYYLMTESYTSFEEGLPVLVGLLVEIPLLVFWVRSWGALQRCSRMIGRGLVVACWALSAILIVLFIAWVD